MKPCLGCHGEGHHDFRDADAAVAEHLDDRMIAVMRRSPAWMAVLECDRCHGTGLMTDAEHADAMASARAYVSQIIARWNEIAAEARR